MPFIDQKTQKTVQVAVMGIAALFLILGQVPVLNVGINTPLVAPVTIGFLVGGLLAYFAVRKWQGRA